jgi:HEPN domain-containing protein
VGNLAEGLRWLDQAQADAKTARDCLEDGNFYATAFFSQQAAEKALKALLYAQGYRALITHSVVELLEEAARFVVELKELSDYAKELDRHYIGSRYPNFYPSGAPYKFYTEEMAKRCSSYAELILHEVKKSITR